MSHEEPSLKDIKSLGLEFTSATLARNHYYLRKDYRGRAVLVVKDLTIFKIPDNNGVNVIEYLSAARDAVSKDIALNDDFTAICDELREKHNYVFQHTWFGKYVLCLRERYDMNLIFIPLKFKALEYMVNTLNREQRKMSKTLKNTVGSYIHLAFPFKKE